MRINYTLVVSIFLILFGPVSHCHSSDNDDDFDDFEAEFAAGDAERNDPFEGYNRFMHKANDRLYVYVFRPVARGYAKAVPLSGRLAVDRFFKNLLFPVRFVNNTLQMKFKGASVELGRFVCNTTAGVLGFWDPARKWWEWEPYNEDFGQTLGHYGVGSGPPFVIPFFGHSNIRDTFSMIPDYFLKPVNYVEPWYASAGIKFYAKTNYLSLNTEKFDSLRKDAVEPYTFFRDGYHRMRNKEIEE